MSHYPNLTQGRNWTIFIEIAALGCLGDGSAQTPLLTVEKDPSLTHRANLGEWHE